MNLSLQPDVVITRAAIGDKAALEFRPALDAPLSRETCGLRNYRGLSFICRGESLDCLRGDGRGGSRALVFLFEELVAIPGGADEVGEEAGRVNVHLPEVLDDLGLILVLNEDLKEVGCDYGGILVLRHFLQLRRESFEEGVLQGFTIRRSSKEPGLAHEASVIVLARLDEGEGGIIVLVEEVFSLRLIEDIDDPIGIIGLSCAVILLEGEEEGNVRRVGSVEERCVQPVVLADGPELILLARIVLLKESVVAHPATDCPAEE